MDSFDLVGPLPTGTTLLEASAGTGKTFTVAALVTRFVAEHAIPLDHTAADVLRDLVALRDRGLREPLPVPLKASLGYARARRTHADAAEALRKAGYDWCDGRFPGEQSDPAAVRAWGHGDPLPGSHQAPRPGEEFAGETHRFGALSLRVWSPLLTAEQGSW